MSSSTQGNCKSGPAWVERQDRLMMICYHSTSAAHHMRQQSQCLLSIKRACSHIQRTRAARWNNNALQVDIAFIVRQWHRLAKAPLFQMQNQGTGRKQQLLLDVGTKPRTNLTYTNNGNRHTVTLHMLGALLRGRVISRYTMRLLRVAYIHR